MMNKAGILLLYTLIARTFSMDKDMDVRKEYKEYAKKIIKKQFQKKDIYSCEVIKCGKEGDACDDNTVCQATTECFNGVCRRPTIGDYCNSDYDCFSNDLYCDAHDETCKKYDKEGDNCTSVCKADGTTLVCDKRDKVCKLVKANPGDLCEYGTICQEGSYCTATALSDGTCVAIPSKVGASCNIIHGCDKSKNLYCSKKRYKCMEYSNEGDGCSSVIECGEGLYCDIDGNKTCKPLKNFDEDCSYGQCKSGLTCPSSLMKCVKKTPEEGDYCDSAVECSTKNRCINNICVRNDGTCIDTNDCKLIT